MIRIVTDVISTDEFQHGDGLQSQVRHKPSRFPSPADFLSDHALKSIRLLELSRLSCFQRSSAFTRILVTEPTRTHESKH